MSDYKVELPVAREVAADPFKTATPPRGAGGMKDTPRGWIVRCETRRYEEALKIYYQWVGDIFECGNSATDALNSDLHLDPAEWAGKMLEMAECGISPLHAIERLRRNADSREIVVEESVRMRVPRTPMRAPSRVKEVTFREDIQLIRKVEELAVRVGKPAAFQELGVKRQEYYRALTRANRYTSQNNL